MERIFEILALPDKKIDSYIDKTVSKLDKTSSYKYIVLKEDGNVFKNWIESDASYLPSGIRSKGFKIDKKFIKDFVVHTKENFGNIPFDLLKANITEDILINWYNLYIMNYLGVGYDEEKRKEIYGYGSLNSIGKTINLSELKGLNVSRCIEKASGLNQILNFLGIDSSLLLSDANHIGHAYCLVNVNNKNLLVDPSFLGKAPNGKGIPYIFEMDPQSSSCTFDPSLFGDEESPKVDYILPRELSSRTKS